MTNEARMTNDEKAAELAPSSGFVIRVSFVLRRSDFVIPSHHLSV